MFNRFMQSVHPGLTILLFVIIAVSLTSTQLMANEQDVVGVYFDEACTITTYVTTDPIESVHYWLAVKDMSSTADFVAINCRLTLNGVGVSFMSSLIGGQNYEGPDGDIMLPAEPHIPAQDLILVCSGLESFVASDQRIEFHISPIDWVPYDTPMYYTSDEVFHTLTPSSGSFEVPVAIINPDAALPGDGSTWGQLKQLYH
jgi:hypothetical protein